MILYCGGGHRSALAANRCRRWDSRGLLSLAGGWTGWTKLELPVER